MASTLQQLGTQLGAYLHKVASHQNLHAPLALALYSAKTAGFRGLLRKQAPDAHIDSDSSSDSEVYDDRMLTHTRPRVRAPVGATVGATVITPAPAPARRRLRRYDGVRIVHIPPAEEDAGALTPEQNAFAARLCAAYPSLLTSPQQNFWNNDVLVKIRNAHTESDFDAIMAYTEETLGFGSNVK